MTPELLQKHILNTKVSLFSPDLNAFDPDQSSLMHKSDMQHINYLKNLSNKSIKKNNQPVKIFSVEEISRFMKMPEQFLG